MSTDSAPLTDITLPADQAEGTTSTVATWFKQVGDTVKRHEPLLELSTDKVTVEIAAPADGILAEVLKGEGEVVAPGELVGRISEKREARSEKRVNGVWTHQHPQGPDVPGPHLHPRHPGLPGPLRSPRRPPAAPHRRSRRRYGGC